MFRLFNKIVRSHVIPYKHYSEDGKLVGKYVIHMPKLLGIPVPYKPAFNIEFTPIAGTHVEEAVRESIKISDKYQMDLWMNWFYIIINIPYKTNSDEETIQKIVDTYSKRFEQQANRDRCVGG